MEDDYFEFHNIMTAKSWVLQFLTKEHIDVLEQSYLEDDLPSLQTRRLLANQLNIHEDHVTPWFSYRRYKTCRDEACVRRLRRIAA